MRINITRKPSMEAATAILPSVLWRDRFIGAGDFRLLQPCGGGSKLPKGGKRAKTDRERGHVAISDKLRAFVLATFFSSICFICYGKAQGGTPEAISIAGASSVHLGTESQYTASIAGLKQQSVDWTVNGVSGGTGTYGTISPAGVYNPPTWVPKANGIIIGARVAASAVVPASLKVTILNQVPVISGVVTSTTDGGRHFLIDVKGNGFRSGAGLRIGGHFVITNEVTKNELQTEIADSGLQTIKISIAVQNSNPGATRSVAVSAVLKPPQPTLTAASRFLDQTSFGPTASSIDHVQEIGLQAALVEQFNQPSTLFSDPPSSNSQCQNDFQCTQSDFLRVTAWGNDQLRQRVAMALSEIWVAPIEGTDSMPFYLNTLANDAFSNYRQIMQDMTLTPQMGRYLNMVNSGAPAPGQIANENFGREMLQLFTIGPNLLDQDGTLQTDSAGNAIASYSELQVEAFARAYTGWTFANFDGSSPSAFNWTTPNYNAFMMPVDKLHDTTTKVLLGGATLPAGQTAEQDLNDALDNIFVHANVGPFICKQIIQHLVTGNPSPGYVQRVSAAFANNGSGVRGDMKAVLTAVILDQEARAGDEQTGDDENSNPSVDGGHLREPLLWTVNLIRGLSATQTDPDYPYPFINLMVGLNALGEQPFGQKSVFNYFPPDYVIPQTEITSPEFGLENTGTVIPRMSQADSIIHGTFHYGVTVDLSATSPIGRQAADPAYLADYLGILFMHSQMPTDMRTDLIAAISAIPATDLQSRAEVAVYLVVTSSQYKIIH